jgi:[protein-PII] uridylyltransferase
MILAKTPPFAPLESAATLPPPEDSIETVGAIAREYAGRVQVEMRVRQDAGEGGLALVAAYTDAIDRLLEFTFAAASTDFLSRYPRINQRCTVVGLGGYGRAELNPASDIDLLFLYPWKVNPYVETVAEVCLYALWDAGLVVGHAMRNIRECARLAPRDMRVMTALLDARYLTGDAALYAEFEQAMLDEVWGENPTRFYKEKLTESVERHRKTGDSVYLLQPQLKEGPGGLRDLHTALWMAKMKFKVRDFRGLVAVGVVTERDIVELEAALDFLWRIRNAMHLFTKSHQDQLTFELQDRLAPTLGFAEGKPGVEAFMRTYYGHAATAARFAEGVVARCVAATEPYRRHAPRVIREGMRIQGRTLTVTDRELFTREPSAIVAVFAEAQRHGVTIAPATRELVRESLPLLGAVREQPAVAEALLTILTARGHVYETLFEMHRLGVLKEAIPEFGNLDCLIAHDPFHIYTVDQHSLIGVRELERLRTGEFTKAHPLLTQVMHEVARPELLFLGMIFHDVGKGHGHDHSGRGARMMQDIGVRLGLNEDERAACEFLVQHHLYLSHLAQRRDLADDDLIVSFCRTVGSVDNLQRLYLLTYADMRAVGPGVFNNWRDSLLAELYVRGREFFEIGRFAPEDRTARAARIQARVIKKARAQARPALERFFAAMPDGYFVSTPEEMLASHGTLRQDLEVREEAGEMPALATLRTHFSERDFTEFAVCTRDRPGLFSRLSGVLAANGMNILAARIATSTDGVALDAFRISNGGVTDHDDERWERVEKTLRDVLTGKVDIEELVTRSRRPSILTRKRRATPTTIDIDNNVSRDYTVLDVSTGDRVGLLFTITNCLYHLWLEIHLAKITTMVDQVLDVFYVTDNEGRKIEDPERLEIIRRELLRALQEPEPEPVPATARAAGA